MGAAILQPHESWPEPTDTSVADAYNAVLDLCDEDKWWVIDWQSMPCHCGCGYEGIVHRFTRHLHGEAVIVAREVDEHQKPVRGALAVVCAIRVAGPDASGNEKLETERRLRGELEALQAVPV